jgi:hypothetical protein
MKLINLTPHAVQIFGTDSSVLVLPACHSPARLSEHAMLFKLIKIHDMEIRISGVEYTSVYNLPDKLEDTLYVVSQMVAQASPERDDLLFPYDVIRNEDGTIFGCKSLAKWTG